MRDQAQAPALVGASGEIDLDTVPSLRRALAAALEAHREVVRDLSEVTFMDCAGMGALVRARNQCRPVRRSPGPVRGRPLRGCGSSSSPVCTDA
ncbi:STAS domain-containing protein [Kitasatospora sp. NPDC085879]|uniref:STAS domain-containing protein n=1 Tax=Kitasatospora sp. NPDC085879 TaxID=3154769 RepID=UPI00343FA129